MNEPRVAVAVRIRPILRSGGSLMHQQERFELVAAKRTGDTSLTLHDEKPDDTCRTRVFTFDQFLWTYTTERAKTLPRHPIQHAPPGCKPR